MLKKALSWAVLVCSIYAFQIRGLGKGDRVLDFLGIGIIAVFLILFVVYQGAPVIKRSYSYFIIFLLMSSFLSAIAADIAHHQSISVTLYQQRAIFYLLFYFLLHYLMPHPKELEKMVMSLGFIFCIFYILQTLVYPTLITEAPIFRDRGTLRIYMPGGFLMVFAYFFIAFQKILKKFDLYSFALLLLTVVVSLLFAGRQLILALLIISIFNILTSKRIKHKLAIVFMIVVLAGAVGYFMRNTIMDMVEITQKHSQEGDKYIRVRAAQYFLFDYPNTKLTYILGNGTPSERSAYGLSLSRFSEYYGFYMSDIGIISTYFKLGLIFTITVMALFLKILFSKVDPRISYVKDFVVSIFITLFTTQFILDAAEGVVTVCILLYIIDYYNGESVFIESISLQRKYEMQTEEIEMELN